MNKSRQISIGRVSFALLVIAVAGVALLFASDIERPRFADNNDPGPQAFPVVLAIGLLAVGVFELVKSLFMNSAVANPADAESAVQQPSDESVDKVAESKRAGRTQAVILIAAICVYVPGVSWLGFTLSTFVFSTGMMIRLGARWWLALIATVAMLMVVHLLFVGLFEVQLPEGLLDGRIPRIAW